MAGIVVVKQDYAGCRVFLNVMIKEVLGSKSDEEICIFARYEKCTVREGGCAGNYFKR